MMKPKASTEHEEGMLEYLEDIIGSSRYKQPIEDCAKSVEELNEARGEKVYALLIEKLAISMKKIIGLFNKYNLFFSKIIIFACILL